MKPTRQTQPYRASGSRAPSQVLSTMLAGKAAGGNALMRAHGASKGVSRAAAADRPDLRPLLLRRGKRRA